MSHQGATLFQCLSVFLRLFFLNAYATSKLTRCTRLLLFLLSYAGRFTSAYCIAKVNNLSFARLLKIPCRVLVTSDVCCNNCTLFLITAPGRESQRASNWNEPVFSLLWKMMKSSYSLKGLGTLWPRCLTNKTEQKNVYLCQI